QDLVEGERVRGVLLLIRQGHVLLADSPAVVAAIALHPPAVEDAAVDPAVDGDLLAAGPAGLLGPARGVEPHVAPLRHHPADLHVVVFDEDELAPELAPGQLDELLDEALAQAVRGM